ncbi:hypothetical protein EGH24_04390 [Halonotius terrestris]|uniref:Uncharacterized protein n=1 Tax=Halonotius terrestris TaxID=2487750 RepID=A0A8J8PCG2_9EURY|nr:hypothetical protein [Halonotius terrestris]TQQ82693.1 hypothetical protein EGH24_04390 [Halonotius terrestris]
MEWTGLFDRTEAVELAEIQRALATDRAEANPEATADATDDPTEPRDPEPTRVVADADVLAADLLVGGDASDALEPVWQHSWTTLVASDELLAAAEAVIETVADNETASDWRAAIESWREPVVQPPGDHPALASAYRGGAMHVLSFDEELTGSGAAAALNQRFPVSVRSPAAFARLFDPESLYGTVSDDPYPGPDREPRE